MITKLKAYAAGVGAALTAVQAILMPDSPLGHVITAVLVLLTAAGVYAAPYRVEPDRSHGQV